MIVYVLYWIGVAWGFGALIWLRYLIAKAKRVAAATSLESYHERACRMYRDRMLGDWDARVDWGEYEAAIDAILRAEAPERHTLEQGIAALEEVERLMTGAEACDSAWRAYRGAAVLSGPAIGNVWGERGTTAAEWMVLNPVLGRHEHGVEYDTGMEKIGDGGRRWNDLPYLAPVLRLRAWRS